MGTTPFSFRRLRLLFLPVGRVVVCRHRPVTHSGNEWAHKRAKSKKENKNATTQMKEKKQELTDECQRLSAEELCVCVGGRAHFRSLQEENRYTSARRTPYKCSRERVTVKAVLQLSIWLSWCRCCSVCYKEGGEGTDDSMRVFHSPTTQCWVPAAPLFSRLHGQHGYAAAVQ